MRLRHVLVLVASGLVFALPACSTPEATPDGAVDAAASDGSVDAMEPLDASDEDSSIDGGEDSSIPIDLDAGEDAAIEPDGGEDAAIDVDASTDPDAGTDIDASTDPDAGTDTDAGCSTSAACDDDDACTVDSCDLGACTSTPVDDDDDDVCTTDSCDPLTGIAHAPIADCCETTADCTSGICSANVCQPASCTDTVLNGSETAVDCGGDECPACAVSLACLVDSDCTSDACVGNVCVQCAAASDCPAGTNECQTATCTANVCGFSLATAGTATAAQIAGNCQQNQCSATGTIVSVASNADVPVDGFQCTSDVCTAGVPSNPDVASGNACTEGGGAFCNGTGDCVACVTAAQCPAGANECQTATCTAGVCGIALATTGTPTAAQTAGNCQQSQCSATGTIVSVASNADVPVDSNPCTGDVCTAGVPSNPPVMTGSSCGAGQVCDASGQCVGCITATDCPGTDTECQARSCSAGVCGFAFTAAGTAVAAQTAGDCQQNQCNGAGAIVAAASNADVPVDGIQCTSDVCTAGVPSNPDVASGNACNQSGGSFCNGTGDCVACVTAAQCPAGANECQTATCTAGVCGIALAATGTVTAAQTAGDCQQRQCSATGTIVSVANNADLPADDGNQCTDDVCTAGVPSNPPKTSGVACNQSGGSFCDGSGSCVECVSAAGCPGVDTECQARTCTAGTCGTALTAPGTVTAAQTAGDCQQNQCDGAGNIASVATNTDVPVDSSQCTDDLCTAGVPSNPPSAGGTACNQFGGTQCDGAGMCVGCVLPSQCPGTDTECQARTCFAGSCGLEFVAAGTPTSTQTAGNCLANQCDGTGNTVAAQDNADLPVDSNQCTGDVCTAGVPTNPSLTAGTACNQSGGIECDGSGACVVPTPAVASTTPANATSALASTNIAVTFTTAMNGATLTGQTVAGACTGSIQVSLDNFASCVAFSSATAAMSAGDTIATFTAAPGLLVNRTYRIRVTTAATSAGGTALEAQFTQPMGFTTGSPNLCEGSVVIAQVFGGGGSSATAPNADYVVLHNRGTTPVALTGWSLQYGSSGGTTAWGVVALSGTIQASAYFLVQLQLSATGIPLPTPDLIAGTAASATNGKFALVSNTTALSGACPSGAAIVDVVGYGTANCSEGTATSALTNSTAALRVQSACGDVGNNAADFTTGAPAPLNSASAIAACSCSALNETATALVEADYCTVQSPLSLNTAAGATTATVYGRLYEAGTTNTAPGAVATVRAQLGYGPASANPQYQAGWSWTNATYNASFIDASNDEYQASFTAPASGSYRYAYRFSLDNGVSWTVCDQNAGDFGAGSNDGLTFSFADEPVLTVP